MPGIPGMTCGGTDPVLIMHLMMISDMTHSHRKMFLCLTMNVLLVLFDQTGAVCRLSRCLKPVAGDLQAAAACFILPS